MLIGYFRETKLSVNTKHSLYTVALSTASSMAGYYRASKPAIETEDGLAKIIHIQEE